MATDNKITYIFKDLKKLREDAGLSRAVLARRAELDRGTIKRLEEGHSGRKENLIRVCNALNELYYQGKGSPLSHEEYVISE